MYRLSSYAPDINCEGTVSCLIKTTSKSKTSYVLLFLRQSPGSFNSRKFY